MKQICKLEARTQREQTSLAQNISLLPYEPLLCAEGNECWALAVKG